MDLTMIQISVFGSFRDIQPDQDAFIKLMKGLPGFIPGTAQHLDIDAARGKVKTLQRIQMNNVTNGWRLEVQIDRLNAVYNVAEDKTDHSARNELVSIGITYVEKCIEILNIKRGFTRLAINAQYIEPTGEATPKIPFTSSLPKYIENFDDVCEWNLTLNKHGQLTLKNTEKTNEILSCNMASLIEDSSKHAKIITVDINTLQDNPAERFEISDMKIFADYALKRWDAMMSSL